MIQFFRKIRRKLLGDNRLAKYMLYAIGEIILVVIGILIALQINNWNQRRIQEEKLMEIYERLVVDMDNDIREMSANRNYWEDKRPVFLRVKEDSITPDLFDQGLSRLLTASTVTNFNTTGVNQLRELNQKSELSLRIIEVYDYTNIFVIRQEAWMRDHGRELINIFRDNYQWYAEWMSKTVMQDNSSPELQNYFLNSMEYRHRVIDAYQQIFNNYVDGLNGFIRVMSSDRTALKMITESDFVSRSQDELQPYSGTFLVTTSTGEILNNRKGDTIRISAHDHFLRITQANENIYPVFDLYVRETNSFDNQFDDLEIVLNFIPETVDQPAGYEVLVSGGPGDFNMTLERLNDD